MKNKELKDAIINKIDELSKTIEVDRVLETYSIGFITAKMTTEEFISVHDVDFNNAAPNNRFDYVITVKEFTFDDDYLTYQERYDILRHLVLLRDKMFEEKNKKNMVDAFDYLKKYGDPEIEKRVDEESIELLLQRIKDLEESQKDFGRYCLQAMNRIWGREFGDENRIKSDEDGEKLVDEIYKNFLENKKNEE